MIKRLISIIRLIFSPATHRACWKDAEGGTTAITKWTNHTTLTEAINTVHDMRAEGYVSWVETIHRND